MMDWLVLAVLAVPITCGGTALLFYVILLRSGWAPRWQALTGVLASLSQITGVFTGVLGMAVSLLFLALLGVVQLAAGVWLVWRGFADPDASVTA